MEEMGTWTEMGDHGGGKEQMDSDNILKVELA